MPCAVLMVKALARDAPEVEHASFGFVHGFWSRLAWEALAMPWARMEGARGQEGGNVSCFWTQMFGLMEGNGLMGPMGTP
jgi:hypothetical protein